MKIKIDVSTHFMPELDWPGEIVRDESAEAWVIDPEVPASADVLKLYKSLKVIVTASTGTNHIDLDYCATSGIEVFSLLDRRSALDEIKASSEFTFFLVLAALRRLNRLAFPLYSKGWSRDENSMRGSELSGKIAGIVGYGRIGQNLYRYMYAFGARVRYIYDPPAGYAHTLEQVFQNSDIVVISCALNEQTVDLIGSEIVQSMKHGACLVNTSRGEVCKEEELVEALMARPDITYAADVIHGMTDGRIDSPLFNLNNTIITPHVAGLTVESNTKAMHIAKELLWEYNERKHLK